MITLEASIANLRRTIDDIESPHWSWQVRRQLAVVRDVLAAAPGGSRDGWLAARSEGSERVRRSLLVRVNGAVSRMLARGGNEPQRTEIRRLVVDLEHYRQRLHDLTFDAVSLELGGSE